MSPVYSMQDLWISQTLFTVLRETKGHSVHFIYTLYSMDIIFSFCVVCPMVCTIPTLQIILDLCVPEKELAKTRSQKELCKPDLNLGSQGCHPEKVINITPWI